MKKIFRRLVVLAFCFLIAVSLVNPVGIAQADPPPPRPTPTTIEPPPPFKEHPKQPPGSSKLPREKLAAPSYSDCSGSPAAGNRQDASYFSDVLGWIGGPSWKTSFAINAFMAWFPYENTTACWNPLATSYHAEWVGNGCTDSLFNGSGVRNYSSKSCGEQATAKTLLYTTACGHDCYKPIRDMLSQSSFNWQSLHDSIKIWVGSEGYATAITNSWQNLWNNRTNNGALKNGNFESGRGVAWGEYSSGGYQIVQYGLIRHSGNYSAYFCEYNNCTELISQQITYSSNQHLTFYWYVSSQETVNYPYDTLQVQLITTSGAVLSNLATYSNTSPRNVWVQTLSTLPSSYAGQAVRIRFLAYNDVSYPTAFYVDDVAIQ